MSIRFTTQDGIIFCESVLEGRIIGEIIEKAPTQNTTLLDLKKKMSIKARALGGNAIINFTYSQKADRGRNLFKFDTERLIGTGTVIEMSNPPKVE